MDLASLIEIVIVIVVIYFFVKFIVSPVLRIIFGIIFFLILITLLQRFGFNIDQILATFGIHLNINQWVSSLGWILGPINYYLDKIEAFFRVLLGNIPKSFNK